MSSTEAQRELLARAASDGVRFVNLQFTDILGAVKSTPIPVARLADSLDKGTWFDGSSIEGFGRICESDMFLVPDLSTYRLLPWTAAERRIARIICDVFTPAGEPFPGDPRNILRRAMAQASALGLSYNTGAELEFYLFRRNGEKVHPVPHDVGGYFDFSPLDMASTIREEIAIALDSMGMEVEMTHHEVGPGQHEIDVRFSDALTCADNTITTRYTVKAIAQAHDLYATFMPKPIFGIPGNGMHTHQSLFDAHGQNAFYDVGDRYHLSPLAYSFLAGQLTHARALSAILSPTVNSYKRLVPGFEAPVYICWGQTNRSALIRIPHTFPGRENSTRAELRSPDSSCSPYLAFAAMLAAGLDGVRRGLVPPEPVEENVYDFDDARLKALNIATLPDCLADALNLLEGDTVLADALGGHAFARFLSVKRSEWEAYRSQVTPWELDRYLEVL